MENNKAGEHTQELNHAQRILKCPLTLSDYGKGNEGNLRIRISAEGERGYTPIADVLEIYNGSEISETTREIADVLKAAPKMLEALEKLTSNSKAMALISDEDFNLAISAIKSAKGK